MIYLIFQKNQIVFHNCKNKQYVLEVVPCKQDKPKKSMMTKNKLKNTSLIQSIMKHGIFNFI